MTDPRKLPQEIAADRVRHEHAFVSYCKKSGWKLLIHLLLIVLAIANVYPFVWMVGTSLKTGLESSAEIRSPLPQVKYGLTDSARNDLLSSYYDDSGQLINLADREAVEVAQRLAEAKAAALTAAQAEEYPELEPAQRQILAHIRHEDIRQRSIQNTYVPYRIELRTYADNNEYRRSDPDQPGLLLPDLDRASAELDELAAMGFLEPIRLQWGNYALVWTDMNFFMYTATSFVVTSMVVIIVVLMSSMLGFALARMRFPGKVFLLMLLLIGSVAPSEAVIIPIFRFILAAGLLENLWGMILWMAGISIGNAFMMAGFFMTLPKEVEEAAFVDGAGPFKTFFAIALPMAKPIVMTVGLLAFLGSWNNFLVPLLTAQASPEFQPLALAVYMFKAGYESQWHWVNAAATIMVVPVVVLFIFLQRYIVNAIAVGAVKG